MLYYSLLIFFFYCINGSHSRLLHPSLVAIRIIKRRLPAESAGSLFWSVRVIRWRRPRFKGFAVSAGASGEPPKTSGWKSASVFFFRGKKKKGYKSKRGTTPRITDSHTHTHTLGWLPASRWVSRRNKSAPSSCWLTKPEGRDWYSRPIRKNESTDFCLSPGVSSFKTSESSFASFALRTEKLLGTPAFVLSLSSLNIFTAG